MQSLLSEGCDRRPRALQAHAGAKTGEPHLLAVVFESYPETSLRALSGFFFLHHKVIIKLSFLLLA